MSVTAPHDQWPALVKINDQTLGLIGKSDPITVYAFHSKRYGWMGVVRDPEKIVDAIKDLAFADKVRERFRAPRSTIQEQGYDLTDLACQVRDTLTASYHIPNPTVYIRIWSDV